VHVTILGGGGFRVPLIARQLAASGLPVSRLVLYDTDPGRVAVIAAVLGGDPATSGLPVTAAGRLDDALRGADVIFAALRPGGLEGRVRDERAALALGVLGQETVGAGGLASAARTVPVVDALARRISKLAPQAWVISMTNPAGLVTEVMAATLGPRVIGVCDSPVGLVRRACAAAGVDPGPSLGTVTDRVDADYLGINHLGWLRGLRLTSAGEGAGPDLLPGLLGLPGEPGRLAATEEGRLFGPDVLRSLGAIPNEYLYWYYAAGEALRDVLAAGRTRGEHVRERQLGFYAAAAAASAASGPRDAARLWQVANEERNRSYFAELRTGERGGERDDADVAAGGYESVALALASALTSGPAARLILNVRNGATVAALPPDMVLEVPCRVGPGGPVPLPVSPPSAHQLGLMAAVRGSERDIAAAALTGAPGLALRAFTTHPLVASLEAARALAAALPISSTSLDLSYRFSSYCVRAPCLAAFPLAILLISYEGADNGGTHEQPATNEVNSAGTAARRSCGSVRAGSGSRGRLQLVRLSTGPRTFYPVKPSPRLSLSWRHFRVRYAAFVTSLLIGSGACRALTHQFRCTRRPRRRGGGRSAGPRWGPEPGRPRSRRPPPGARPAPGRGGPLRSSPSGRGRRRCSPRAAGTARPGPAPLAEGEALGPGLGQFLVQRDGRVQVSDEDAGQHPADVGRANGRRRTPGRPAR
jgi:6-phospho-beta-glucosidase